MTNRPCKLKCRKCGSYDCNRKYVIKGDLLSNSFADSKPIPGVLERHGPFERKFILDEGIYHKCRTCGYEWVSETHERLKEMEMF